jgi:glutamate racemase
VIGVFDSGVGGLSVLRHIRTRLPAVDLLYLADQAHVPYGERSPDAIRRLAVGVTRYLRRRGARLIVVACNTASAAALTHLRQTFPGLPFVGMEPAVKPAAAETRSGTVGVMATAGTFGSERYASLVDRFGQNIRVVEDACPGLVEAIEAGEIDTAATAARLRAIVRPMLAAEADTVVLGCTHYPFVQPLLAQVLAQETGRRVTIIDPAPAVARQTARLWRRHFPEQKAGTGQVCLVSTVDGEKLAVMAARLLGERWPGETAVWRDDILRAA